MKKKLLALVLVVVLALTSVIGGTMAYLTDTDEAVNVMTLGNVSIKQHEYERAVNEDGTYKTDTIDNVNSYVLQDFTQAKPLLPIVGDPSLPDDNPEYAGYDSTTVRMTQVDSYGGIQVFAGKNAQDKFVTVENTGKTDAYVRTLVAIECGTGEASLIGLGSRCVPAEEAAESTAPWVSNAIGEITVDGNTYYLFEYVYRGASDVNRHVNGVLPAGDTTYPSLCQVYLKSSATNEDCEKLDGNGNGTLDILVLSQAVQTAGFEATAEKTAAENALDTAFGDVTAEKAAKWYTEEEIKVPVVVAAADELSEALAAGKDVILTADVEIGKIDLQDATVGDVTIYANGNTITTTDMANARAIQIEGANRNITIVGANIITSQTASDTDSRGIAINNGDYNGTTTVTLKDCTLDMASDDWAFGVNLPAGVNGVNLVIDNCTLEGSIAVNVWGDNNNITITNSTLLTAYDYPEWNFSASIVNLNNDGTYISENNTVTITNCHFDVVDNTAKEGDFNGDNGVYAVYNSGSNNTVTVENCTYGVGVTPNN